MNTKLLMTSASTVAIAAAGGQQAFAQDAAFPAGYTLDVKGSYGILNNVWDDKLESGGSSGEGDLTAEQKFGASDEFRAYTGSVSLSRDIADNRDVRAGLSFAGTVNPEYSNDKVGEPDSGGTVTTETALSNNQFTVGALDVDIGQSVGALGGDARLFAGARILASESTIGIGGIERADKLGGEFFSEAVNGSITSTFVGLGPRVGASFETPVSGQLGVSGELGLAMLFGQREISSGFSFSYESGIGDEVVSSSGSGSSFSDTSSEEVMSLDARLGVDYYLSPTSKLSAGYQLQQYWNVDVFSETEDDEEPRLIQGLYVGFTTTF